MKQSTYDRFKKRSYELSLTACYSIENITNKDDLDAVRDAFNSRYKLLKAQQIENTKAVISVGDEVKFDNRGTGVVTGTLTKINRTKVQVKVRSAKRDEQGSLTGARSVTWTVPITLLDLT